MIDVARTIDFGVTTIDIAISIGVTPGITHGIEMVCRNLKNLLIINTLSVAFIITTAILQIIIS